MATGTIPSVKAEARETLGTRATVKLRQKGKLPIVLFGHKQEPVSLAVDHKHFVHLLHEHAHLIELETPAGKEPALVKEVQWDHLSRDIIHADLERVDLSQNVTVEVTLQLVGDPAALEAAGALLDHPLETLSISCRADSIPEIIKVNIGDLQVGDSITAGDVTLPEGVELETEPTTLVAQILIAKVSDEDLEEGGEAADAAAQPEVIGKKDEEEEDEG